MNPRRLSAPAAVATIGVLALLTASPSARGATDDAAPLAIECRLRFPAPQTHYVEVEMRVPTGGRESLELALAVWTPGSYLMREYARHLESVRAGTVSGESLAATKSGKNRWRIETRSEPRVIVSYRVYCRVMSVRDNWIDSDMAILNGAPTFLVPVGAEREVAYEVRLELPPHWKRSVTPLAPAPDAGAHHYRAASYDELVDSPIIVGNPAVFPFEVEGRAHTLVNLGGDDLWDGAAAARDVERIVREQMSFWGTVPYGRYAFLNVIGESGGGLEHASSTLLMTSRWSYRDRRGYLGWLGLVSHEFFHTWNVKALRPRALVRYDFETEQYTPNLWIAEGITSYYDDLLVHRAGLSSRKEYLDALSRNVSRLQTTPGRLTQSLSASSHDTWIKFYRADENSVNSSISYYTKGAVVGFLLDVEIRRATSGARSLDDVMRALYERHSGERGYTAEEFRALASEVAGRDLAAWLADALDTTEELDYEPALEWLGLAFESQKASGDAATDDGADSPADESESKDGKDGPDRGETAEQSKPAWLGASTSARGGRTVVTRVPRDTPAFECGLNVDDEIIAIGAYRVPESGLDGRLQQYRAGDAETLLVARRGRILHVPVTFGERPARSWTLKVDAKASDEQKGRLDAWLGAADDDAK